MSWHGLVLAELPVTPPVESGGDSTLNPSLAPPNHSPPKVWSPGTSDSGPGAIPSPPRCRRPASLTGGKNPLGGEPAVSQVIVVV